MTVRVVFVGHAVLRNRDLSRGSAVRMESILCPMMQPQAVLDQLKQPVLSENQHQASFAEAWLRLSKGKVLLWGSVCFLTLNPSAKGRGLK